MEVKTTYLQMFAHAQRTVVQPRAGLTVVHAKNPTIRYYRFLYHAVGVPWQWLSRGKLTDEQLASIVQDPRDEIHVLHVDGVPAGFAELDRWVEGEVELVQFGLMPEFIGQGLGKWFLQWTIDLAWSYGPKRYWLHTCSNDHPNALPNYRKAGFAIYKEETKEWLPPAHS
jgi:GNAT superfamily N-acetyltransferase